MPCYRCGRIQTDPVRGASPWARGLVGGELILVCPDCQEDGTWTRELTRCKECGNTRLSKVMGVVVCRACGAESEVPTATDEVGRPPGYSSFTPPPASPSV